jgi:ArsR family transcriptional regulator, arsenate/arsenite/antimonite-responsive transcriptional repressor
MAFRWRDNVSKKAEEELLARKALVLRTLGHPVRLKIVAGLAGRCACVKEIWECLGLPQAVVSQHLKVMKESGILDARREGVRVCYSLKDDMLADLIRAVINGP